MASSSTLIRRGLRYLRTAQLPDGGFSDYATDQRADFAHALRYRSVFPATYVLESLASARVPESEDVQRRTVRYLMDNRSARWTWNYWTRGTPESHGMPYPDDLDDTAGALLALSAYNPASITGEVMAHLVETLTAIEQREGGPYRTWIVPPDSPAAWRDVDVAVNAQLHGLLTRHEIELPQLTQYIESAIAAHRYDSPYYPDPLVTMYYISRWYHGPQVSTLLQHVQGIQPQTALQAALIMHILLNYERNTARLGRCVNIIDKSHTADGSWPAGVTYSDPAMAGRPYVGGSPAITTALCVSALHRIAQSHPRTHRDITAAKLRAAIYHRTARSLRHAPSQLQSVGQHLLNRIQTADTPPHAISLSTYWTVRALGLSLHPELRTSLRQLGQATIQGWMAYTIFDQYIDTDHTEAELHQANYFLSQSLRSFDISDQPPGWPRLIDEILDTVDDANAWELEHCRSARRLPRYGSGLQLSDRSLGHALGPLAIALRYRPQHLRTIRTFFRYYLAARQLSDDAHDWLEDLQAGHYSSVVTALIDRYRPGHLPSEATLTERYWVAIAPRMCQQILRLTRRAQQILTEAHVPHPQYLTQLLVPLQNIARQALAERRSTLDFLRTYRP